MVIKTLTTYDVYNYGASLQAYALMTYLARLGHDVEVINYQPDYLTRKYDYKWVNPESALSRYVITRALYRIMKYIQRQTTMGRKREFDEFNHKIIKETIRVYHTFGELCKTPPEADLYIVGSDQVWNVFYETGRDPAFYLEFVNKGDKASYAASFSYLDIDEDNRERIKKSLETFKAVSVREYQGVNILSDMGIHSSWVLDPVFLLTVDEWKEIMTVLDKTDAYILVYDFEGNEEIEEFTKQYAKRHHLKIYSINDTYPRLYADRNFSSVGPREFLSLIYHCDAFVSNSFHGTAFSIIFHKPLFVFERHRHKVNSRMESLLTMFQLGDHMITTTADYTRMIESHMNFDEIDMIMKREIDKSKAFIKGLL